jgi:hypothetical protein
VIGSIPIHPAVEHSSRTLLVIVKREVSVLEPDDLHPRRLDPRRVQAATGVYASRAGAESECSTSCTNCSFPPNSSQIDDSRPTSISSVYRHCDTGPRSCPRRHHLLHFFDRQVGVGHIRGQGSLAGRLNTERTELSGQTWRWAVPDEDDDLVENPHETGDYRLKTFWPTLVLCLVTVQ